MASTDLSENLRDALSALQSGRDAQALSLLNAILARWPEEPDALQLLGLLRRKNGDQEGAVEFFRRSLAARPAQPNVCHNLGNALLACGRRSEAEAAYAEALRLAPDHIDARIALGEVQFEGGKIGPGCETLARAVEQAPENGRAWSSYGRALRAAEKYEEAVKALRRAVQLRPDHVGTRYNLAVALRLDGQAKAAADILQECRHVKPDLFEIAYVLGHCLQDLGQFDDAAAAYRDAIRIAPTSREAHDSLSQLLWQHEPGEAFLRSYAEVLSQLPDEAPLLADLAEKLGLAGRTDDAIGMLRRSRVKGMDSPEIDYRLGQMLATQGEDLDEALTALRAAATASPVNHDSRYELIRLLLRLRRHEDAETALAPLLSAHPFDQQAIALRDLLLRLRGDPPAQGVDDLDRLIWADVLEPPEGYGGVEGFNRSLAQTLDRLHRAQRHPIGQTLRGGTQTMGNLLDRSEPEIVALRGMLEKAVASYIKRMPVAPRHPLFGRRGSGAFRFSGSWSVRLSSEGFHLNHIHPAGWISSCYYVSVPQEIAGATDGAGSLSLGQSNLDLGPEDRALRQIKPVPGLLALFPSYLYHGTLPFRAAEPRTTVAFDVIPT